MYELYLLIYINNCCTDHTNHEPQHGAKADTNDHCKGQQQVCVDVEWRVVINFDVITR